MPDLAEVPVPGLGGEPDLTAGQVADGLMAQADAEHRPFGGLQQVRDEDVARALRAAGPG